MALDIQIKRSIDARHQGTVTVELGGRLDSHTAPELERQLMPIFNSQIKDLVFDLAKLVFISSAGLRIFAIARKRLKDHDGQAAFINLQPQIQEVFEIIKALPGIAVFQSVAELDDYLAKRQRSYREGS